MYVYVTLGTESGHDVSIRDLGYRKRLKCTDTSKMFNAEIWEKMTMRTFSWISQIINLLLLHLYNKFLTKLNKITTILAIESQLVASYAIGKWGTFQVLTATFAENSIFFFLDYDAVS